MGAISTQPPKLRVRFILRFTQIWKMFSDFRYGWHFELRRPVTAKEFILKISRVNYLAAAV